MRDIGQVTYLIGEIYDASVDTALWPSVLGKARAYVGGAAAALFAKDAAGQAQVHYQDGGVDERIWQRCMERYAGHASLAMGHNLAGAGEAVSRADLLPESRPFADLVCAVLDKPAGGTIVFGILRDERDGKIDETMRGRMRLIVPHIRRAVSIGRAVDLKAAEAASFTDTLDGVSAGLFLVDSTARIVHANLSGLAMLSERAVLRAAAGKLVAIDAKASAQLNEVFVSAGSGGAAAGSKGLAVPLRAGDGSCFLAHVLPLSANARRSSTTGAAVAALFVHKAELQAPSPPEAIACAYGLTPSELRVLLAIVQVGGVPETAAALGLGEATVKTHLHRVFGKTGATRQADLVKLVAGFSHPLVGRQRSAASPARRPSFDGREVERMAAV